MSKGIPTEVVNAIDILKDFCNRTSGCENCPLSKDGKYCVLADHAPIGYPKIIEETTNIPKTIYVLEDANND